jgi:hypothetical protein
MEMKATTPPSVGAAKLAFAACHCTFDNVRSYGRSQLGVSAG